MNLICDQVTAVSHLERETAGKGWMSCSLPLEVKEKTIRFDRLD